MPIAELTAEGMEIETLQEILDGISTDQRDPTTPGSRETAVARSSAGTAGGTRMRSRPWLE